MSTRSRRRCSTAGRSASPIIWSRSTTRPDGKASDRRHLVEEVDIAHRRLVEAGDGGIAAFDEEIFVRGVGAAAMAQAELAGGLAQGIAGEDEAGPGAGAARAEA